MTAAWRDYAAAARAFSRPARLFLVATFLVWTGRGIQGVLFNLYLVESGHAEAFVGRALGLFGAGVALAALPAGLLAERWGRRRTLLLALVVEGAGMLLRSCLPGASSIAAASFVAGVGTSLFQIPALPFLAEHSLERERTYVFSAAFAASVLAGVAGSAVAGAFPALLGLLPALLRPGAPGAHRAALLVGALAVASALLPLLALRGLADGRSTPAASERTRGGFRVLAPIALNYLLVGCGAGLVIPFMNLYFKDRFGCSAASIGAFYAVAALLTAAAGLAAPALARRFGTLRAAVAFELLSLPFLVTLAFETGLATAVAAFWVRAALMQGGTPLVHSFVMEALPPGLRARATGMNNMLWNAGWAVSTACAGPLIQRGGFALPFYLTAALYGVASVTFYLAFRRHASSAGGPRLGSLAASPAPAALCD